MTDSEIPGAPIVQKKAANPPGILPRNAQAWFIGGISILMVLVIALSGGKESKARDASGKVQTPQTQDPNQQRIEEYRTRIDEQARKLAAEQAQLAQTKEVLGITPNATGMRPESRYAVAASQTPLAYERPSATEKNWIETDREKREYQSLFASNVALSYRPEAKPGEHETKLSPDASLLNNGRADSEIRVERAQPEPVSSGIPSAPDMHAADMRGAVAHERDAEIDRAQGKKYRLFEGTVIETVLTNRLDGSFSGPVNCMVTTNVYSHDRQRLLVPQGTRVLGEVKRLETFGQERLAVAFHRLIMPDGYSVSLDQFQGLNQIGETGLRDQVNHHYLQVFGVSLAIGAIAGLSQVNTRSGLDASAEDAYRQGVASSLSQSSLRILDRYLNVLPTFTIREGHRIKVYLAGDLLLPAYENHQMPGDL
ncbi:MAG: TrbI/VirB10 family protein [Acidobacteriia bacterium]|nr:TrbI/VirB10 family protein [Terriglobia bacterium]